MPRREGDRLNSLTQFGNLLPYVFYFWNDFLLEVDENHFLPEVVITNPTCIDFEEKNAELDVIRPPAWFIKTLKITSDSEAVFS